MAEEEEVVGVVWEVDNPFLQMEGKRQQRNRLSCRETHRGAGGAGEEEEEGVDVQRPLET